MKKPEQLLFFLAGFFLALGIFLTANAAMAQGPQPGHTPYTATGTAFTYQGQLKNGNALVDTLCDFQFGLWNSASAAVQVSGTTTQTVTTVVSNGLFTAVVDFGMSAFNGDARWLAMAVRCPTGNGGYTSLNPPQALTAVPYAQYALNALNRNAADTSTASISAGGGALYDFAQSNYSSASSTRSVLRLTDNVGVPGTNDYLIVGRNGSMDNFSVKTSGDVSQAVYADGLVKAGANLSCGYGSNIIYNSFNNVNTNPIRATQGITHGECTVDFGFHVGSRYLQITPNTFAQVGYEIVDPNSIRIRLVNCNGAYPYAGCYPLNTSVMILVY